MLNKLEQLLNIIGQRGMRDECVHICHLEKIAQTQQVMFPPSVIPDSEIVFHAGRVEPNSYRCAGCGETFHEDDIHGFYQEESLDDSDLDDAPIYKEEFPETEYNPDRMMPGHDKEIPKLLGDFLIEIRKLIQVLNRMPPQVLDFEMGIKILNRAEDGPIDTETPPVPARARIKIDDISQIKMEDIMGFGPYHYWNYERVISQGFMLYINGEEVSLDQVKIISRDNWTSIQGAIKQKVEALYKTYLSENIDDIRAKLEQIGDQIKSYKAVLPNYIRNILKNISEGKNVSNPDRLSGDLHLRSMHQALQDLQGVGRRNMFGIFLFAITTRQMSGNDYVNHLIEQKMLYGSEFIMQLQSAADKYEVILNILNLYIDQLTPESVNSLTEGRAPTIKSPVSGGYSGFGQAERLVKYPVCEECAEDLLDKCDDCWEEYLREDLKYLNTAGNPICEGCVESYYGCEECGELVHADETHATEDGDIYCEGCYESVMGADEEAATEHLENALRGGVLGLNTPRETGGQTQVGLLPVPASLLSRAIPVFRRLKLNDLKNLANTEWTTHGPALEGVVKKLQSQGLSNEDALLLTWHAQRFMAKQFSSDHEYSIDQYQNEMNSFLESVQSQVSSTNSFYDTYPLTTKDADGNVVTVKRESESGGKRKRLEAIRRFTPIGVDYSVTKSRYNDIPSFTIVMEPSAAMIKSSEILFGREGPKAWDTLSVRGTQHHSGAIAYARISKVDGESYVINNLQRDADIYNLGKETLKHYKESNLPLYNAIKWWDKKVRFWHVQFLLTLTEFAKAQGEAIFLTPFDVQKRKWGRIPDRNKDAYSTIPGEMSVANRASLEEFYADREEEERNDIIEEELFPRMEHYDGAAESVGSGEDLWRLAENFERKRLLYKIAAQIT